MTPSASSVHVDSKDPKVQHFVKRGILKVNAKRMLVFCLLFAAFQLSKVVASLTPGLGGFFLGPLTVSGGINAYTFITLAAACLGLVFAIIFGIINTGRIKNPHTQNSLIQVALLVLTCVQLGLVLTEYSEYVKLVSFLFYVLLLGIVPVLPRVQGLVYIGVFTILFWALYFWLINTFLYDPAFYTPTGTQALVQDPYTNFLTKVLNTFVLQGLLFIIALGSGASWAASWIMSGLVKDKLLLQYLLEQQQEAQERIIQERTAEYKEEARVSEAKNLAKTRFLTRVSHELRTSMNTVSGMVFLAKEAEDPASRQESLDAIDQASTKIKKVVNNIIDTTQIESEFAGDDFNQDTFLLASDALVPPLKNEPVAPPDLSGNVILIVEDLETNRIVLREFLKDTHATIEEAVNGREAVEMFTSSPENHYAFIFMDLLMPEMSGHDATRAIRKVERADAVDIPIVAVSANAFKEDIEASLAAGMDAHLAKPIEQNTIFRTLIERLT